MNGSAKPPPYVICYLCGRKYGTKSIAIHGPSCIKKWHAENRKLPKHLRRKMPTKPDYSILTAKGGCNENAVEQMNEMAFKAAQEQLIPCEHCGRTFYPEKLPVHQKSCTVDNPARRAAKTVTKPSAPINNIPSNRNSGSNNNNNNEHPPASLTKNQNKPKTHPPIEKKSANSVGNSDVTIPCGLCQGQFQINEIAQHLMECNEQMIKNLQNTNDTKSSTVSGSRKTERPTTRTLHRGPPTGAETNSAPKKDDENPPQYATYDIDSPDEEPSTIMKSRKSSYTKSKKNSNTKTNYPTYDVDSPEENEQPSSLSECHICNRKFASDRLSKHMAICKKTTSKGRKVFNSSKQRLEGTEAAQHYSKAAHKPQPVTQKSNWRQTHQDFIRSIRNAKQVTVHMAKGGKASDLPPPPPSLNPDYIHCKYCDRRFNPTVAERHIPHCATTQNRPKPPKQKALDHYRPPPIKKPATRLQGGVRSQLNNASGQKKQNYPSSNGGNSKYSDAGGSPKYNQNSTKQTTNYIPGSQSSYSPRYEGYTSPRETNNNSYRPMSKQGSKSSVKARGGKVINDPYKSKTFSGIDSKKSPSRGYSYNAMNYTSPNFFG